MVIVDMSHMQYPLTHDKIHSCIRVGFFHAQFSQVLIGVAIVSMDVAMCGMS